MSKPTKNLDGKEVKQYYGIAKICFFIMVFNIVVRLDLWVSIAGLIVLLPYLLQKLLLNKIDATEYLNQFGHYISAVKNVHQKPTKENIATSEQAESTTVDFEEPSFESIWQDCPRADFVWNDYPCVNNQREGDSKIDY